MSIEELKSTPWALKLKSNSSKATYEEALKLALTKDLKVSINYTNETGSWVYAIVVIDSFEFWMDAFTDKEDALKLVTEMGWVLSKKD